MGVPVITLKGNDFLSRVGESIVKNLVGTDWVARDQEAYVSIAKELGSDLERLSRLRKILRSQIANSSAFDGRIFARDFENTITEMWRLKRNKDSLLTKL